MPAVEKVLSILEVLARSNTGLTLRELADACGVPKSSVHCILITLQRCGYLHRNPRTSRYLFGLKWLMLTNTALGGLELREQAEPHMRALARRTRLPVHLGIVECDEAAVVAKVDFVLNPHGVASWVGKRMELHCTALGKALIAGWNEPELRRLVRERCLPRHNDNTISSLRRLIEELAKVRAVGYAIDDEEDVLGCRCVGAPVFDALRRTVAAISVSGTTAEIAADNVRAIAAEVQAESAALSRTMTCLATPDRVI